tara:strand:- start:65 stop:343 length:279 start_codon:yes stop_codon:yes gene_type:complete
LVVKETQQQENIMSQTIAKRPLTTLQKQTKKSVIVRLKNDVEYRGKIDNVDSYMNLIMTDAEELKDGKTVEKFGRVILRGNNVLFIKLENEL